MNNLALVHKAAGRLEKALPLFEEVLAQMKAKLGSNHPRTLTCMNNLAGAYEDVGQLDKALPMYEEALAKSKEKLGREHPTTLVIRTNLAGAYQQTGELAKTEGILRESLTLRQQKHPGAWRTFSTQSNLGASLLGQKKYAEAEPHLLAGYEGLQEREGQIPRPDKKALTKAVQRLVQLYDAWGKKDQADVWRQRLAERTAAKPP